MKRQKREWGYNQGFFDNKEENLLVFGAEMNGVRTAVRSCQACIRKTNHTLPPYHFPKMEVFLL